MTENLPIKLENTIFSNDLGGILSSKMNQSSFSNSDSIDTQIFGNENNVVVAWWEGNHTTRQSCIEG
jgi:hypothetical protein